MELVLLDVMIATTKNTYYEIDTNMCELILYVCMNVMKYVTFIKSITLIFIRDSKSNNTSRPLFRDPPTSDFGRQMGSHYLGRINPIASNATLDPL